MAWVAASQITTIVLLLILAGMRRLLHSMFLTTENLKWWVSHGMLVSLVLLTAGVWQVATPRMARLLGDTTWARRWSRLLFLVLLALTMLFVLTPNNGPFDPTWLAVSLLGRPLLQILAWFTLLWYLHWLAIRMAEPMLKRRTRRTTWWILGGQAAGIAWAAFIFYDVVSSYAGPWTSRIILEDPLRDVAEYLIFGLNLAIPAAVTVLVLGWRRRLLDRGRAPESPPA